MESGAAPELAEAAANADARRQAGEDLGPPPTPTPVAKRRYDSSQTAAPRTLAPNPDIADIANPSASQTTLPAQSSPQFSSTRFPALAQATAAQAKPIIASQPTVPTAAEPASQNTSSVSQQQPSQPPSQPSRTQHHHTHHHHSHSQHKANLPGPRAGYFSDDLPRAESRPTSQSTMMPQLTRAIHQIQPQMPAVQQASEPSFRPSFNQQEREIQARMEQQQDRESQARYQQQHARRFSQEMLQQRQYQASATAAQIMSQIRPISSAAGSPETRTLPLQQPSMHASQQQQQPSMQHLVDTAAPAPNAMGAAQLRAPHQSAQPPAVKEEPRQYSMPPAPPATQPTPAPSKPAEPPRKSNLMSLLNDAEPEEPRRKRPSDQSIPSHTPTPQQQAPIAPPPPVSQSIPRRDVYGDVPSTQSAYSRPMYSQQQTQSQVPSGRQVVDLTRDQTPSHARQQPRESWPPRQPFHPSQSQPQQGSQLGSPRQALAQPNLPESRIFGNHRSVFAQHNTPRHNPSPPPHGPFAHSPHIHSRTPSLTQASQQPRHNLTPNPIQHAQQGPGSAQILQPNPYAQVDPPGTSSQPSGPVGMRPSPHLHTSHVQQQEMQGRSMNERAQSHNTNLAYSNPQTPSDGLPPHQHQHLRGPSMAEPLRARDIEFDARNRERDVGRELSQRADMLMRERDGNFAGSHLRGGGPPSQSTQDLRYTSQPPPDRGYLPPGRSHTPLSRPEHSQPPPQHSQHPSLQHPHTVLLDNVYRQQQEESHQARLREAYQREGQPRDPQSDRFAERIREEQVAHQQARIRNEELFARERDARERDARFREEMMRRERERGAPAPLPQQGQQQGQQGQAAKDWTMGVRRPWRGREEYDE